jgi:hypothetical protein
MKFLLVHQQNPHLRLIYRHKHSNHGDSPSRPWLKDHRMYPSIQLSQFFLIYE